MSSITRKADHLQYPHLHLEAQGNVFAFATAIKVPDRVQIPHDRDVITEFSAGSRRRLLRLIARLEKTRTTFITLTYPAEYPTPHLAKKHLRALLERIRRRCPEVSGITRFDFQERGAPHFHLLLFNLPFISFETLRSWWQEIIGVIDSVTIFVRIELVRSWRGVMSYAAKYLAKKTTESEADVICPSCGTKMTRAQAPDEWVCPRCGLWLNVETGEVLTPSDRRETSGSTFFNDVTYLHAKTELPPGVGRFWGVFNRKFLPLAELVRADIAQVTPVALKKIKQICKNVWKGVNLHDYRGAVLFSDRAYDLYLGAILEALADLPCQK